MCLRSDGPITRLYVAGFALDCPLPSVPAFLEEERDGEEGNPGPGKAGAAERAAPGGNRPCRRGPQAGGVSALPGGHSAFGAQPAPRGRGEVLFLPRHCGMCPNKTQNRLSATVKTFLLWKGTL